MSVAQSGDEKVPLVLTGEATLQIEVKKSRFIAHASPASCPGEAMSFLERVRDPGATHNCWAYRICPAYRFSDDGEPAGTAGRPMLSAIERRNIDQVMVIVTRFFGGIKLGAGGLARAYGGVTSACLQQASTRPFEHEKQVEVSATFSLTGNAYNLLQKYALERHDERYDERGVVFLAKGPQRLIDDFVHDLVELSSGGVHITEHPKPS
ncbi:YigZ family protein [Candidatus Fermentibacteria bacterium]|nr:YigZ family protein [Candidatus Fermentibacteria bacterium]